MKLTIIILFLALLASCSFSNEGVNKKYEAKAKILSKDSIVTIIDRKLVNHHVGDRVMIQIPEGFSNPFISNVLFVQKDTVFKQRFSPKIEFYRAFLLEEPHVLK